jgi:hypothetical protein
MQQRRRFDRVNTSVCSDLVIPSLTSLPASRASTGHGLKGRSPREIFDMQQRPRVSGHTLLRLRLRRGNDVLDPRGLRVLCPEYPLSAKCSVATAAHSELASQITALLARSSWRSPCRSEKLRRSSSTAPTDPYRERALRSCAHGAAAVGSCARSSLLQGGWPCKTCSKGS